ncbi:spermidine synthase [Paenibacillus selenitireducens]|uniref:Spermidine synthase n=1 Tax=Paenibacillus selenitireducens TaxID=1324314 RepID=A0A1T2X6C8_9BACL|nr:spermidine synthase [Paenibacillus selenitireducens]
MHLLVRENSFYQEMAVYEANELYGETGKFRFLQFSNHAIQGAIDLKNPERIVLEYPRAIMHLMECNDPDFERVFMIGHGIGTIAGHYEDRFFTVAEIDEKIVELSRTFFHYRQDNVVIGDGRQVLECQNLQGYDYIVLDAFTREGTPYQFTTTEFFQMTREKLTAEGALIMNLMGKAKNDRLVYAIHTTVRETYAHCRAFTMSSEADADIRNIIVVCSDKIMDYDAKGMAGFYEIELGEGHVIMDKVRPNS